MTIQVVCAIILFGDKVLVTQRSGQMSLPLKWEFPGGKLEDGETEIDCIEREIKEEINISIKVGKKMAISSYQYPSIKVDLIPYIAQYISGEIELLEHSNFKLLRLEELDDLDWAEADIPIVEELRLLSPKQVAMMF